MPPRCLMAVTKIPAASASPSPTESNTGNLFMYGVKKESDMTRRDQQELSKHYVKKIILDWIDAKYPESRDKPASYVLGHNSHSEPLIIKDNQGNALTWQQFTNECATTISMLSAPVNDRDCWFCHEDNPRVRSKTASGRSYNPRLNVLLKFLTEPYSSVHDVCMDSTYLCRRLIRGRLGLFCVNPSHVILTDTKDVDRQECDYGWHEVCEHDPKCLWTNPCNGARWECLDMDSVPTRCRCKHYCPVIRVPFSFRGVKGKD